MVEPHTLVAAERSWFLVCWDLQSGDWRTFRVDRMSSYFGTRRHFVPRELPAADAAEFVTAAIAALHNRVQAEVVMRMPLAAMREHFGPWAESAVAIDEHTTSWPIRGDTFELMLSAVVWVPTGVEYELRGSDEFLALAREAAARMSRAVA